jgi:hypothetical protein
MVAAMKHPEAIKAWRESRTLLCDRCATPLSGDIADYGATEWAGAPCTPIEYVERAKENPNVWIVCAACLHELPDAVMEDLEVEWAN